MDCVSGRRSPLKAGVNLRTSVMLAAESFGTMAEYGTYPRVPVEFICAAETRLMKRRREVVARAATRSGAQRKPTHTASSHTKNGVSVATNPGTSLAEMSRSMPLTTQRPSS